jgi:hypothetical protein
MEEVTFGQYAVPVILTVILGLVYKMVTTIPDKWKSLIAVGCGIGLGMIAIPYNSLPFTVVNIVDHAIYGLMTGASAVGLWELSRTVIKPRNGGTPPPKIP